MRRTRRCPTASTSFRVRATDAGQEQTRGLAVILGRHRGAVVVDRLGSGGADERQNAVLRVHGRSGDDGRMLDRPGGAGVRAVHERERAHCVRVDGRVVRLPGASDGRGREPGGRDAVVLGGHDAAVAVDRLRPVGADERQRRRRSGSRPRLARRSSARSTRARRVRPLHEGDLAHGGGAVGGRVVRLPRAGDRRSGEPGGRDAVVLGRYGGAVVVDRLRSAGADERQRCRRSGSRPRRGRRWSARWIRGRRRTGPARARASHTAAALPDGSYVFRVRATDGAGNQAVATRSFSVDTVDPAVAVVSGPAGPTNNRTPSFGFTAEAGATVECSVDQGTPAYGPVHERERAHGGGTARRVVRVPRAGDRQSGEPGDGRAALLGRRRGSVAVDRLRSDGADERRHAVVRVHRRARSGGRVFGRSRVARVYRRKEPRRSSR